MYLFPYYFPMLFLFLLTPPLLYISLLCITHVCFFIQMRGAFFNWCLGVKLPASWLIDITVHRSSIHTSLATPVDHNHNRGGLQMTHPSCKEKIIRIQIEIEINK